MRGGGYADVLPVLQVPDNKADAVPCERLPDSKLSVSFVKDYPRGIRQIQAPHFAPYREIKTSLNVFLEERRRESLGLLSEDEIASRCEVRFSIDIFSPG